MSAIYDLQSEEAQTAGLIARLRDLCGDDEQAFIDMVEGETEVTEAARAVIRWMNEQSAASEAMKSLAAIYSARAKVFADRDVGARNALFHLLQFLGIPSMALPEATLSISAGAPQISGEPDVEQLPEQYVRVKREADKVAILAALKRGEYVPGCSLSNTPPRLSVRGVKPKAEAS